LTSNHNPKSTGLWIALYGPDGAGKSAVAARLATELAPLFSGLQLHHLRVPLWGSKRPAAVVTSPHAQRPRGFALSCMKLFYVLAQSWLAHLLRVLPWVTGGQLVLLDRYFLDYVVDTRRYRLPASSVRLASLLGKLAPRPDLQFVLDVRGEELQRRKPEVSLAESKRQRGEYAARIAHLRNAILVDADRPVAEVAADIITTMVKLLNYRSPAIAHATPRTVHNAVR
jgi:thymidylate kinase